jgi:hypothetical protein
MIESFNRRDFLFCTTEADGGPARQAIRKLPEREEFVADGEEF